MFELFKIFPSNLLFVIVIIFYVVNTRQSITIFLKSCYGCLASRLQKRQRINFNEICKCWLFFFLFSPLSVWILQKKSLLYINAICWQFTRSIHHNTIWGSIGLDSMHAICVIQLMKIEKESKWQWKQRPRTAVTTNTMLLAVSNIKFETFLYSIHTIFMFELFLT